MAKGNDGNLLQHCVEAELAHAIAGEAGLNVVLTHGMAPFENPNAMSSSSRALFENWWNYDGTSDDLPQVIRAYQTCRRLDPRYPNSAEILRALLGPGRINGFLCEVNTNSIDQIESRLKEDAWKGAGLALQPISWRRALRTPALPTSHPWLISMDPMQFVDGDGDDNDFLSLADLRLVQRYSEPLFRAREPGALVVFSYSMKPSLATRFRTAILKTFPDHSKSMIDIDPGDDKRHVAALICTDSRLAAPAVAAWSRLSNTNPASGG